MPTDQFDDKKIIPQPFDNDTRANTTIKRIQARLPSLDGKAGKYLKVSADEEGCEWATGGSGGSVSFADITGAPEDNAALNTALESKVEKAEDSQSFTLGVERTTGKIYYEIL